MKKNHELKIKISKELNDNILKVTDILGLQKSQLIRGILNHQLKRIIADFVSNKENKYSLSIKNDEEVLIKEDFYTNERRSKTNG